MKQVIFLCFFSLLVATGAQAAFPADSAQAEKKTDYQIFLKQPAREINLLMYEKNFLPIQGKLSDDRKAVIMQGYQFGSKVRVKVTYEDGTEEEFVKSPCYIDPVVL